MAYRIGGCGLGTVYAYTKERADEEYNAMGLCSESGYPTVTEFIPRYWAVQQRKDGNGDEHWIWLDDESSKDAIIHLAHRRYIALTKEEKREWDITVYEVGENCLKEDGGFTDMDIKSPIWKNGEVIE